MTSHLVITLGLLGAILGAVQLADRRLKNGGTEERVQSARWAKRRDLRPLVVEGPEPGRMIVGRQGKRLIAAEARASVIAFAPTQTLKTRGLVVPVLREWNGPALVTSVKTDVLQLTRADRAERGDVFVFDPLGESNVETVRISPLSSCVTWDGAQKVAHWIGRCARQSADGLQDSGFWYLAAEKLIAPLFFAATVSKGSMANVIAWLNQGQGAFKAVKSILAETNETGAIGAWQANLNREERQRSSIYTTAETMLSAYADPAVLKASCDPNFHAADLLDGKCKTLYLYAPEGEQERLRTLFSTVIMEVISRAQASASTKPLDPALLLALDEAANVAPIPNLAQVASTGAGQGIQLLSIFQDASQVVSAYGKGAQTIVNNHKAKLIGGGVSDVETINLIRAITGASEFRQQSETSGEGRASATTSSTYRDLAPANVIREIKPGEAMLVYAHLPPLLLRLRAEDGHER